MSLASSISCTETNGSTCGTLAPCRTCSASLRARDSLPVFMQACVPEIACPFLWPSYGVMHVFPMKVERQTRPLTSMTSLPQAAVR